MHLQYNGKNARKNQNTTTKYIYKSTHHNKIKTKTKPKRKSSANRDHLQYKCGKAAKKYINNKARYIQACKIFNKLRDMGEEHFNTILDNYEEERDHSWFRKTKNILERGVPEKIYNIEE